ncbi:Uncharacterised protein [Mycobacteroides abscessus subsp. abscessus]|nr:Uncharacterised protein [Mycobacteroides abscessus subsp. abscessus]
MLLPCNQISPICPSGSSVSALGLTMTAHWLRATCPQDTCGIAFSCAASTRVAYPAPNCSRST